MITSKSNPKIKKLKKLQKSSKARNEEKVFVAEGPKMIFEVPYDQMRGCFVGESFYKKNKDKIREASFSYEVVTDEVFDFLADTKTPQGIVGVIKQSNYSVEELLEGSAVPLLLLLESIQDPGNVGTIFRTAEAAGVTGIIMNDQCADIYNPKTVRSTMGAITRMPFIVTSDFEDGVKAIRERGIKLVATGAKAAKNYDKENYQGAVGFIIGNESSGLSQQILNLATEWVKIPMKGQAESLNAAIATGILVYEACRQRG